MVFILIFFDKKMTGPLLELKRKGVWVSGLESIHHFLSCESGKKGNEKGEEEIRKESLSHYRKGRKKVTPWKNHKSWIICFHIKLL